MKTLAAVAVLFAFLAGVTMSGGGDPFGIAAAVASWSAAKVQVAQIDANVQIYRIGVDAVQRANDRGMMYMLLGAGLVLVALVLPRIMRHWESEDAHYARLANEQTGPTRREVLGTAQSVHAGEYDRAGFHLANLPSNARSLNDTTLTVQNNPTRHARRA